MVQVRYLLEGISNHTLMLMSFLGCPKKKSSFKYCEKWDKDPDFHYTTQSSLKLIGYRHKMSQLMQMLKNLRWPLKKLNRDCFADIHRHQEIFKAELEHTQRLLHDNPYDKSLIEQEQECRVHYVGILHSSLTLIK